LDLTDVHVAEAHLADLSFVAERGERANAGLDRRTRIHDMQLIQVDHVDLERGPARIARGAKVLRATVGLPRSARTPEPTLGCDLNGRAIAAPRAQRSGDQSFVVTDLRRVTGIAVGGVEQCRAGIERGVDDVD